MQGPSLKRPVAVGRETHWLYILDRQLVQQVQFITRNGNGAGSGQVELYPHPYSFLKITLIPVPIPIGY